jgi:hypothetical protein
MAAVVAKAVAITMRGASGFPEEDDAPELLRVRLS